MNIKIFVGGPIQFALGEDGRFDKELKRKITELIEAYNNAGCEVYSAHLTEGFGETDVRGKSMELVARDFEWTRRCDVYVAVLPSLRTGTIRSDGTCVEIGWASGMHKPIVLLTDYSAEYSHMINGLSAITEVRNVEFSSLDTNPEEVVKVTLEITKQAITKLAHD